MEINAQLLIDKMSRELGTMMSNNMLLGLQVDALTEQYNKDQALIEALRQRCIDADTALKALREVAHPINTRKAKK
jgi:hypothetical protein